MAFRTKLDYSDNRQINQRQRTFTNLEGGSVFGVAYSAMTSGVGTTCSATTDEYVFTGSTFSGNGTTTMYTWFDPRMEIAAYTLSALTSSNSGETQNTGNVFVIDTTATTVDGYIYALTYTGTSFDLSVDTMYSGAGPVFTGTVTHDFIQFLSACSLDYTGTTMWIDNPEKTRTKRLVITENATPNHVWTCLDIDGNGGWSPSSGGTSGGTDTFVTGSSWNGPTLTLNRNDGGAVISTYPELWTAGTANNTAALIGYAGLTNDPDAAYFDNGVTDMISGSTFSGNTIDMNDGLNSPLTLSHDDQFGGTEFLKLDSTILLQRNGSNYLSVGNGVTFLKSNNQSSIQAINTKLEVKATFGIFTSTNNPGGDASIHAFKSNASSGSVDSGGLQNGELSAEIVFGGPKNGVFDYDGVMGTGLGVAATGATGREFMPVFISTPRAQARDNTSYSSIINSVFIGGSDNTMLTGVTGSVIVGGTGHTINSGVIRTVVLGGIDITADTSDMVYVPDLVIDGLNSTDPLATDANGKIVAGVSDARLKTNINDLDSPLEKVLNLRGVSYEWTPESNMGSGITKYGLIAQEVQKVIPDIVRLRAKTDDTLTLSYTEIVPWLIEAVKELASDDSPLLNRKELILKTQTIASEDNNIELNFGGTNESALNGGITVIKGTNDTTDSEFKINSDGDWVTNNYIKPFGLKLPRFTPTSTNDKKGKLGEVTRDNDYIYIKSESGWKRTNLETF